MIKLINLDIFYPELWLPYAIDKSLGLNIEEEIKDDEPINMQF